MLIQSLYDPVTKSSIKIKQRMDGGGFLHINNKHPLFNELKLIGRLHDIPFRGSEFSPFNRVWVYVICMHIAQKDDHNLKIGGIYFKEWGDNFEFVKQIHRRQKLYQRQEQKKNG